METIYRSLKLGLAAGLLTLAGCATRSAPGPALAASNAAPPSDRVASSAQGEATAGPGEQSGRGGPGLAGMAGPVQIVRYVGVDASNWPSIPARYAYSDLYSRIILFSTQAAGSIATTQSSPKRDYRAENRPWPARLLANRTDTVTAVLNVTLRDPGLTLAIPLFSVSHASGLSLGNTWSTVFTSSNVESPLFRIGPNTSVTAHLASKVSSSTASQGASLAVSAVTTAVRIAAPTSPVLTTLSKQESANAASAIDTALSSLLSEDISEDVEVGRLVATWTPASTMEFDGCAPFVRVSGTAPPSVVCPSNQDFGGGGDSLVGQWHLSFACPRLSVFDTADVCTHAQDALDTALWEPTSAGLAALRQQIAARVSDTQVLSFALSSQTNVQAFVLAQPWFTAFVAMSARQPSDYVGFCSAGIVAMEGSGLNGLDAALVVKAMIRQLPQLAAIRPDFALGKAGADCLPLLSGEGVIIG